MKNPLQNDYVLSVTSKLSVAIIGVVSSAFCTRYLGVMSAGLINVLYVLLVVVRL